MLLSKLNDSLDLKSFVAIDADFNTTAKCMLRSFLDQTANDTEKLVTKLQKVMDTGNSLF